MTEEISKQIIFGAIVRSQFKVLLEMINGTITREHRALLEKSKKSIQENLNPDLIVLVGLLEEQLRLQDNIKKLIEDVINLDWSKETTMNQFKSMKTCLDIMNSRNNEIFEEFKLIREPYQM